jgi:hypothetical protein
MSVRDRSSVDVVIKPRPKPRKRIHSQEAGELVETFGGSEQEIETAERGVYDGDVAHIVVYGMDEYGNPKDKLSFEFDGDADELIELDDDLDAGAVSAIEAIDRSLGEVVKQTVKKMRRKGLQPAIRFVLEEDLYDDEERLAEVREALNLQPAPEPDWGENYEPVETYRQRADKDNGTMVRLFSRFRKG